jgi:16S rRNA U516 pseudouridylate synthase RsuA-like enzyme
MKVMPEEVSILEGSTKLRVVVGEGKKHEVRGCSTQH